MISVGIDVSKNSSTVCILRLYGEVVAAPYEILHTEKEVGELADKLLSFTEETRVVLEATGAYHMPILTTLKDVGIFVSVTNPLAMKKYASQAIRKGKTDKLDSIKIANYGLDNWFHLEEYQLPEEVYDELKLLGRQYSYYVKQKVQSKLALTNILDRTMPGIKTLLRSDRPGRPTKDKLCDFVKRYWHFDKITRKSEKQFVKSYCEWAKRKGYHANEHKAQKIYATAKAGIPTLSSKVPSSKMLTLEAIRVLQEICKTLETILIRMQELAKSLPEFEIVGDMQGVGEVLAPRLIAEIGDVRRFHSGSALIAYAGIDAPPYQSGSFYGTRRRISKRGSAQLRKTGYEVMQCIKRIKPTKDTAVYDYMIKKEKVK